MDDRDLQLLTGYVDGVLTPSERQAAEKLLRESAGARALVEGFRADRDRLHQLPRHSLSADFADDVLDRLRETVVVLAANRLAILRKRRRRWMRVAVAAVVLVGIGLLSFGLLDKTFRSREPVGAVRNDPPITPAASLPLAGTRPAQPPPVLPVDLAREWARLSERLPTEHQLAAAANGFRSLMQPALSLVRNGLDFSVTEVIAAVDYRREGLSPDVSPWVSPPVLTAPASILDRQNPFRSVELRLPQFLDMRELDRKQLLGQLTPEAVHSLDMSCWEQQKAFARLQQACQASGIRLVVDGELRKRIDAKTPVLFMVYFENVSPDTFAKMLEQLQALESKAEADPKAQRQFGTLHHEKLDAVGRRRLAESLGLPAAALVPVKPPAAKPMLPMKDPTRPVAADTLRALEQLLQGQGGMSKPGKPARPIAIAVPYVPNRTRMAPTPELKTFQEQRAAPVAGNLQVVFFVRPGRG